MITSKASNEISLLINALKTARELAQWFVLLGDVSTIYIITIIYIPTSFAYLVEPF